MALQPVAVKSKHFVVSADGPLLICRWNALATPADYAEFGDITKAQHKKFGVLTSVAIVAGEVSRPDEATRVAMKENAETTKDLISASAVLIITGSLAAMVVRTLINGMNAISTSKVPNKAFTEPQEMLKWLSALPSAPPQVKALTVNAMASLLVAPSKAA